MPLIDRNFSDIITFSRGTNATYFDSAGVLKYAPNNAIRNNTMQNAAAGTPGTVPTNWTISSATGNLTTREIVGTGTENGITYIDVRFVTSGAFTASVYPDSATGVASLNGQSWTASYYVKLSGGSLTNVTVRTSITEQNSGGTFLAGADSSAFVPTSASLASQRFSQTYTNTNASTAFEQTRVKVDFTGAGDVTLRIGLPQLEIGATAGPAIPTSGTAYYGPRFDYNPSTLAAQGLLIEEARTNLALQSADFGTTWGQANVTVNTNAVVSPDGTSNADNMLEAATTSEHYVRQFFTGLTANTVYTTTVFVKNLNGRNLRIRVLDTDNVANGYFITVSPSLGTVVQSAAATGSASSASGTITPVNGGWYRVILSGNAGASCTKYTLDFFSMDGTTNNFAGDITKGLTLFGAQLELGAFPTSYIPTTTTTVTRAADVASVNTLSPWFNATEGTLFAEGILVGGTAATFPNQIGLVGANANTDNIRFAWNANSGTVGFGVRVSNIAQAGINTGSNKSAGSSYKVAGRYAVNNFQAAVDGTLGTPDTSGTLPTITSLLLGGVATFQPAGNLWLRRATFYPRALADAELQAITA